MIFGYHIITHVHYASHMCDTAVRFENPVSHMYDSVDYLYVCVN